MPDIRPFRALRFDATTVGDLAAVVAPPYTRIDAAEHERLLARHPANVVRVDLPEERHGDEPDVRYRRAARALAEWRSGRRPAQGSASVHLSCTRRTRGGSACRSDEPLLRGYFARLRLETLVPDAGIQPATTPDGAATGDAEDRYKILRATGVNTSPIVGRVRRPDRCDVRADRRR